MTHHYNDYHAPPTRDSEGVKQLRQQLRQRTELIEELVWAIQMHALDHGEGIHPYAWGAVIAALDTLNIPYSLPSMIGDDHQNEIKFLDLDWTQRQRDRWRHRNEE